MVRLTESNIEVELNEVDLEEIGHQVVEGYTSGHLDDGEGKSIYWELNINSWKND